MKNFKKILFLLAILILPSLCFAGCFNSSNNSTAWLQLKNNALVIQQYYIVGDQIQLNGQKFDYFKSIDDKTATETDVEVTNSMIEGFSTTSVGKRSFKIKYKNASTESFEYSVYQSPSISGFEGKYSCTSLGNKTLLELTSNKVNVLTYSTYQDVINNTPKSASLNFKIGVDANGNATINFGFDNNTYSFYNFVNNKPTMLATNTQNGSISTSCKLVDNLTFAKLNTTYTGSISSQQFNGYTANVTITETAIKITLEKDGTTKSLNFDTYDFSILTNAKLSATDGANRISIFATSENEIKVVNNNDDSSQCFTVTCQAK